MTARAVLCSAAIALPRAALACPACGGNRTLSAGYFVATAILIATPVALVALLVLWLRRAARNASDR